MVYVVIISVLSCAGMIAVTFFKPKIRVAGAELGTLWMVTCIGAAVLLASGLISSGEVLSGLTADSEINPIKILILFISMAVLSIFLDETGFFRYMANIVLKRGGNNQIRLFTAFYIAISVLTVFTSNDVIILTFTPFICYFTKNAKIDPIPYLVSEFVAANTASMLLIIGNPTNIYIASSVGIGFADYVRVMALPTLFSIAVAYLVMFLLFRKRLRKPLEKNEEKVGITQKPLFITALVLLSACTAALVVSSYINIEMWFIAVLSALLLTVSALFFAALLHKPPKELARTYRRAPWELVPFIVSMFVIILSLEKYGVTEKIAVGLGERNVIFVYGAASLLFANIVNNIPMSVLFSSVLKNSGGGASLPSAYAVIIGSNIGAFLTPVGALAGIMWLSMLRDNKIEFGFVRFLKYGVIISLPVAATALTVLAFVLGVFCR